MYLKPKCKGNVGWTYQEQEKKKNRNIALVNMVMNIASY
jgi:hypothetical protein